MKKKQMKTKIERDGKGEEKKEKTGKNIKKRK